GWPLLRQRSGTTCPWHPLPISFLVYLTSSHACCSVARRRAGYDQGMLTIPPMASSFAAQGWARTRSRDERERKIVAGSERKIVANKGDQNGGCGGKNLARNH